MAAGAPDIGSLLAGPGGGGGAPPGPQGGMGEPPADQGGGEARIPDLLQQALDAIHQAFGLETDPIDKADMAKILTQIQTLFATEQKEKDQAMGGANVRLLRRNR